MAVLTRLVLVAVLVTSGSVQGIQLTLTPSTIVDEKTTSLQIRCNTDALSNDKVYAIGITKPPSTTYLAIVDADGARVDTSIQQRATATGTVNPAAGSNLVLTFNDAITCSDAGDYQCQYSSQNTPNAMVNQTLQATSDPRFIEMLVRPTMVTYNVNDTVELVCSGFLGKPATSTWVWETQDNIFGSTWTSLRPGLTPVDETPVSSGLCQMTGRSTLTFQVQMEDDNRTYRCYFRDPEYSANFTFQVVGPSTPSVEESSVPDPTNGSTTTTVSTPTTGSTPTACLCAGQVTATESQASSGLSTGAAVAISVVLTFLLTLAATLAVGFLLLRHRLMPGPTTNNGGKQDGDYSGLDLSTREPPRVNNVYNHVGPYAN